VFIEAKDDGGGGDNWTTGAISRAKLQSNHQHQQTNIQFFYRPDALPVAQPTVSKLSGYYSYTNETWHSIIVQDDTKLTYSTDVGSIFYWHALYFYNVCHVT